MIIALLIALAVARPPQDAKVWRKVETVKGFEGMRQEIQHLVDSNPELKAGRNHACVVVQANFSGGPIAWVHVREAQWLYAFDDNKHPPITDANIWGGGSIDLKRDVVAHARDIKGSTSRETRADVNRILTACAKYGDSLVIEKRRE